MKQNSELMSRGEWNEFWQNVDSCTYIRSYKFHDYILLNSILRIIDTIHPKRMLEIGSVNSKIFYRLPRTCKDDISFFGLDPSIDALRASRTMYDNNRVFLTCGDLFSSPLSVGKFGVVASFGLIEHYRDPQPYIRRCLDLLAPGGTLIAGYPSYRGLTGWIQRLVNPAALEHHFSLSAASMATEFECAGLHDINCRYFGLFNPNMIDWGKGKLRRELMYGCFAAISPMEWLARIAGIGSLPGLVSSYVMATGRKPA